MRLYVYMSDPYKNVVANANATIILQITSYL